MGTRATIRIKDGEEEYFIYRGHDGFPENILPHLENVVTTCKGRWSGAEAGTLAAFVIAMDFDVKKRLPCYELTQSFHGDESYRYFIDWKGNEWLISIE